MRSECSNVGNSHGIIFIDVLFLFLLILFILGGRANRVTLGAGQWNRGLARHAGHQGSLGTGIVRAILMGGWWAGHGTQRVGVIYKNAA